MAVKRKYALTGGGSLNESTVPRKRRQTAYTEPSPIPVPSTNASSRRVLRARRTHAAMDIDDPIRKRQAESASESPKRVRNTLPAAHERPSANAPPAKRGRIIDLEQESRAAQAAARAEAERRAAALARARAKQRADAIAHAVLKARADSAARARATEHMERERQRQTRPEMPPRRWTRTPEPAPQLEEPIEEIFAADSHPTPKQQNLPPKPSVDAVLLQDGRCAVRIVRESGEVQGVIINPPWAY